MTKSCIYVCLAESGDPEFSGRWSHGVTIEVKMLSTPYLFVAKSILADLSAGKNL